MRNRPYGFDINFKTIRTIAHVFVAFSENLNFTPNDDHFRKVKYFHLNLNILSFNLSKVL